MVWGQIRHPTNPTNPELLAALKAKPAEGAALDKLLRDAPDTKERRGTVTGKTTLFLPADHDTRKPFVDPTPRDWRHVAIEASGDAFNLVSLGARMTFLPGDLKFYDIEDALVLTGLTLEQAVVNGRRLEAVIKLKK
jgi:hypothetical protein